MDPCQTCEETAVFANAGANSLFILFSPPEAPLCKTADTPEEAEAPYRYLFETNPQPMWIYDSETLRFLLVNEAALEQYGYTREEFLSMTIKDIRPAEDVPLFLNSIMAKVRYNVRRGVWRHRKKDEQIIDVEVTVHDFPLRGRTARLALLNDVTEHRRIERALQQSEQEQRQLAEHLEKETERLAEAQAIAKVGSWDLNLTTNVLFWSEETYRIFGMDQTGCAASYEAFLARVHPDDRAVVNTAYTESTSDHLPYAIDYRMQMEDGSIKIVHERCRTIYDADGRSMHSLGTVQDITQQKQAEQQLTRSLDLLRAITEGSADAIFAKDVQGRYLMINTSGAALVGKTPEEILGQDDTYLFAPEAAMRTMEIDRSVMESGETRAGENASLAAGVTRTYQSTRGPLRDQNGAIIGVVGISRDITEQKQAERTLQHIMEGAHCLLWQAEVEESSEGWLRWKMQVASAQAAQRFLPLLLAGEMSYGEAWYFSRPLEDRERTDRYATQEIRAGRNYQQEFRCINREGALCWLSENVRVETLETGKWQCTGVCTDITERNPAASTRKTPLRCRTKRDKSP